MIQKKQFQPYKNGAINYPDKHSELVEELEEDKKDKIAKNDHRASSLNYQQIDHRVLTMD